MVFQVGALLVVGLGMLLETEAFLLPQSLLFEPNRQYFNDYTDPRKNYGSDERGLTFPGQIVLTGRFPIEQNLPNEQYLMGNYINEDDRALKNHEMTLPVKRAPEGIPAVSKRIHTCAFMRRLGLPIGLCFKGSRTRVIQQPRVQVEEESPAEQDAYAYLERQWPVHSMLGGGVGK